MLDRIVSEARSSLAAARARNAAQNDAQIASVAADRAAKVAQEAAGLAQLLETTKQNLRQTVLDATSKGQNYADLFIIDDHFLVGGGGSSIHGIVEGTYSLRTPVIGEFCKYLESLGLAVRAYSDDANNIRRSSYPKFAIRVYVDKAPTSKRDWKVDGVEISNTWTEEKERCSLFF